MSLRIHPQDFHFAETGNDVRIRTSMPRELLDDPKQYMPHLRQFRLAAGDKMTVQVMNEAKDRVLHMAEFLVIAAVEANRGYVDDYGSRVNPVTEYQIERITPWWSSALAPVEELPEPARAPESYVRGEGEIRWNPGKQGYDVMVMGEVVATVLRQEGEDKESFRARALAVAAGSDPLPLVAAAAA